MTESQVTSQQALREYVLAHGHDDWVPIISVHGRVSRGLPGDSVAEHQRLVVETVRSLLVDGLIEIGDIPGKDDPGFMPWPGTMDDVMTQFIDRFVDRHDDRLGWEYTIWLNLTPEGEQASAEIVSTISRE